MVSWKCLLNMLISSGCPFRRCQVFPLRGFNCGLPSPSYLLNPSMSSRDLTLFQGRPRASLVGYLGRGLFKRKEMSVTPPNFS